MQQQIDVLRGIEISMSNQLQQLPLIAKTMYPDMVRRAEVNLIALRKVIGEIVEVLNVDAK